MLGVKNPQLIRDFASSLNPSSFFDNPDDCSVLLRPMDVKKPCEDELNKSEPGLEIPARKFSVHHTSFPAGAHSVAVTTIQFTQKTVPTGWTPISGVANEGVVDRLTPNLFFRFRCQLYAVYGEFDKSTIALATNIQRVGSSSLLHRRCWRCVDTPTRLDSRTCSLTCGP